MNEDKFNNFMHMVFLTIFTLVAVVVHSLIKINNSNVDLLTKLSDKAGIECQVKTNSFWYVTVKKIVK